MRCSSRRCEHRLPGVGQTDFTYLKVIGWGWLYLSTILDDFSRYVVAWKLCTTMKVHDVTETLNLALEASGCDSVKASQVIIASNQSYSEGVMEPS